MQQRSLSTRGLAVSALAVLFLLPAFGMAQAPGVLQGPSPAPVPVVNPSPMDFPRITTYGFSAPLYYYNYSPLPTYMTSINYPWIYGMYVKGETPITYPTAVMQEPYRARPALSYYNTTASAPTVAAMTTAAAT